MQHKYKDNVIYIIYVRILCTDAAYVSSTAIFDGTTWVYPTATRRFLYFISSKIVLIKIEIGLNLKIVFNSDAMDAETRSV